MYLAGQDDIQIYHDYKCDYANKKVLHKFDNIEYCKDFEGNEDEILAQFQDSGLGWHSSLDTAIDSLQSNGAEIWKNIFEFEEIQPNQAFFIDKKSEED